MENRKSKNYKLDNTHVQNRARISYSIAVATKEKRDKAKVTQGEYGEQNSNINANCATAAMKQK